MSNAMYQAVDPAGDRAAQPREPPDPPGSASIPAPNWATATPRASAIPPRRGPGRRTARHPASMTVGPSHAATRSGSPRPHSIANGIPQTLPDGVVSGVLKSPWASNQAIARRAAGRARAQPGHRPGMRGAVAAEDQEPRVVRAVRRATPRRGRARAGGTRRSPPGSSPAGPDRGGTPGRWCRSPASRSSTPARPGRARKPLEQAELAQPGRGPFHPGQVTAERGRDADDRDRCIHRGHGAASWIRLRIAEFALERYFARWEFAAEHLLCASDVEGYPMAELLALADDETRALWDGLRLGYTESTGHPLLRARDRVALRDHRARRGARVRGRRGGGLLPDERARRAGRSRHRDLARLPEPVRGGAGERRRRDAPRAPRDQTAGRLDLDLLQRQVTPATRLIVVNAPHNPTGMLPDRATYDGLVAIAAEAGAYLLARRGLPWPRVRRGRSPAGRRRCPPDRASRSGSCRRPTRWPGCGSAGWPARDRDLLARVAAFKDYTTICSSGAVGDPRDHRVACPRAGPRPLARDHRGEPRPARRLLRGLAGPLRMGPPAGGLDRLPAADRPGRPDRRLGGGARRGRRRPAPARAPSSAIRATTSGSASAGPTCPRRSIASRLTRRETLR